MTSFAELRRTDICSKQVVDMNVLFSFCHPEYIGYWKGQGHNLSCHDVLLFLENHRPLVCSILDYTASTLSSGTEGAGMQVFSTFL